jgi:hypothetical protein
MIGWIPGLGQEVGDAEPGSQKAICGGIQPLYSKTEQDNQPTNHAAEDSGKRVGSQAFSDWMRFLQTTTVNKL